MKAKYLDFVEGSGCFYCQRMFEPDDEICFDANFRDYVKVCHVGCAKKNGKILGEAKKVTKDE